MKHKAVVIASMVALSGCDMLPPWADTTSVGSIILVDSFNREIKIASVHRIGIYCWTAWYSGVEQVLLRSDGTASNPPFDYEWTLYKSGARDAKADAAWFAKNCRDWKEIPQ